jgi:hypothetical protein
LNGDFQERKIKKIGIAFRTELRKTILPPKLTNLLFQAFNRFLEELIKGSQVASLW